MTEFELIRHYFQQRALTRSDVILGIGDDAAIVQTSSESALAISTDTLISGVHFPEETAPFDIGYKAMAVNLSDLAAMGATPRWVSLALSLPACDETWLQAFSDGFFTLCEEFQVQLIGGDTVRGPLSITVTIMGDTKKDSAFRRASAQPNDHMYVTGNLGDAAAALAALQQRIHIAAASQDALLPRLNRPTPRISLALALRQHCNVHAAIDISDGLLADLQHILEASNVGARIYLDHIPLSSALQQAVSRQEGLQYALAGGDDYELCFTLSAGYDDVIKQISEQHGCLISLIGVVEKQLGLRLEGEGAAAMQTLVSKGYQHFR